MLASDHIAFEDIWVRFLAAATHGVDFMVFIHCERRDGCLRNVQRQDLFTIVPTVPSKYCTNLIGPELKLLSVALKHSEPGSLHDKFVLVSHSSLPVKPWPTARRILTENMAGMAIFKAGDGTGPCVYMKHSMWWALSSWHAERMLAAERPRPDCWPASCIGMPEGCRACMDEVWPLVSIYGKANLQKPSELPSNMRSQPVIWLVWDKIKMVDGVNTIDESYDPWKVRKGRVDGHWGPATVRVASPELLAYFASRDQLAPFARKFERGSRFSGNLSLAEAFDRYIFSAA